MSKYKCKKCGNESYDYEYKCKCGDTFINKNKKDLFSLIIIISSIGILMKLGVFIYHEFNIVFSIYLIISVISFFGLFLLGVFNLIDTKFYHKMYLNFVQSMYREKITWGERSYVPNSYVSSYTSTKDDSCDSLVPFGIGLLIGIGI